MSRGIFWLAITVAAIGVCPVLAQTPEPKKQEKPILGEFTDIDELSLEDLLDVNVSIAAGRIQKVEESPGIVSVITAEEIRRRGIQTLDEALQIVPGFEVLINNLGRKRISVRGTVTEGSSENVLVLFNGQRLNEQITGGATANNLEIPVYNLKQIEIIRGPGSALFGSNAFVGVINLVPHTSDSFDGVEVSAGGGTFGTQQYSVLTGHILGKLGLSTSFHFKDTGGPDSLVPEDAQTALDRLFSFFGLPAVSLAPATTQENLQAEDFSLNAVYGGFALSTRFRREIAGTYIGPVDTFGTGSEWKNVQFTLAASQKVQLTHQAEFSTSFHFAQNRIAGDLYILPPGFVRLLPDGSLTTFPDGPRTAGQTNTRRYTGNARLNYMVGETNQLTLGAALEREHTFDMASLANWEPDTQVASPTLRSHPSFIPESQRTILSFFAQDTWDIVPELGVTLGMRYEKYSDFGSTVNPRAALVWRLPRNLYLKALYGRAFRAPTFFELSSAVPSVFQGERDLQPSIINTVELSLGYKGRNWRLSGNYFSNYIRNFIVSTKSVTVGSVGSPVMFINSPGLNVHGMELELKRSFGFDDSLFLNYTFQHPVAKETGVRFADAPAHLANAGVTIGLGRYFLVSPTIMARGRRPRIPADSRDDVPAYALVNLNIRLRNLFETLEISGTINNLLDKSCFDPSPVATVPGDYPRAGRNAFFRVLYKF